MKDFLAEPLPFGRSYPRGSYPERDFKRKQRKKVIAGRRLRGLAMEVFFFSFNSV
jgi:hypothetical protein